MANQLNLKKVKPGRKPGAKTRITMSVKEALLEDFNGPEGGAVFFAKLRENYPSTYATLLCKMLPVIQEVGGTNGEELKITVNYQDPNKIITKL